MPSHINAVAVFCGARVGNDPAWRQAADALGRGLAKAGIRLVYGGGRVGLMAAVADAALAAGGAVTGVIPDFLRGREVAHPGVTDLVVTGTMHERKALMVQQADAFVTLPGGFGTLDETIEVITWRQLGLHDRPVLIVNLGGWGDERDRDAERLRVGRLRRPVCAGAVRGGAGHIGGAAAAGDDALLRQAIACGGNGRGLYGEPRSERSSAW